MIPELPKAESRAPAASEQIHQNNSVVNYILKLLKPPPLPLLMCCCVQMKQLMDPPEETFIAQTLLFHSSRDLMEIPVMFRLSMNYVADVSPEILFMALPGYMRCHNIIS